MKATWAFCKAPTLPAGPQTYMRQRLLSADCSWTSQTLRSPHSPPIMTVPHQGPPSCPMQNEQDTPTSKMQLLLVGSESVPHVPLVIMCPPSDLMLLPTSSGFSMWRDSKWTVCLQGAEPFLGLRPIAPPPSFLSRSIYPTLLRVPASSLWAQPIHPLLPWEGVPALPRLPQLHTGGLSTLRQFLVLL